MPTQPPARRTTTEPASSPDLGWNLVFACWLIAATSTLGALFFSEVMGLPPCVLCWYQRIFMFPLALLLPVGLFPFDPRIARYALPLTVAGWSIAFFHVLLTYGLIPESVKPCVQGVPCAQNQIEWFGFVSIPLLSLAAFSVINALLLVAHYRTPK
jgi:disulfide bond formation protein DsbB